MIAKVKRTDLLLKLPLEVINLFTIFGQEIRMVGGAVRDLLLDRQVKDFDFATTHTPNQIKEILSNNNIKYVDLAEKFGTIIAVIDGKNFEITTLRQEYEYNGRHCLVKFTNDFYEDAKRRDFTINALYMDKDGLIYDYFDGVFDLEQKKIRFIGDANLRIKEDYLRILRFFRFSALFYQNINQQNLKACIAQQQNLLKLSKSRIREEFLKIIAVNNLDNLYKILKILQDNNFCQTLFGKNLQLDNFIKINDLANKLSFNLSQNLKIAILFVDSKLRLDRLKDDLNLTKSEYQYLKFFVNNLNCSLKDQFFEILARNDVNLVKEFYIYCQTTQESATIINEIKQVLDFLEKYAIAKFPLNGNDILRLGFKNEEIGEILKKCKVAWLRSNLSLTKVDLLKLID